MGFGFLSPPLTSAVERRLLVLLKSQSAPALDASFWSTHLGGQANVALSNRTRFSSHAKLKSELKIEFATLANIGGKFSTN